MSIHKYSRSNVVIYDSQFDSTCLTKSLMHSNEELYNENNSSMFIQNKENFERVIQRNKKFEGMLLSTKKTILINCCQNSNIFDTCFKAFTYCVTKDCTSLEDIKILCSDSNTLTHWDRQIQKLIDMNIKIGLEFNTRSKMIYYTDTITVKTGILFCVSTKCKSRYYCNNLTVKFRSLSINKDKMITISDISELFGSIESIDSDPNNIISKYPNETGNKCTYSLELNSDSILEYSLNLLPKVNKQDSIEKIKSILVNKIEDVMEIKCQLKLEADSKNLAFCDESDVELYCTDFINFLYENLEKIDLRQIHYKLFTVYNSQLVDNIHNIAKRATKLRRLILNLTSISEAMNRMILEDFKNLMICNKNIIEISSFIKCYEKLRCSRKEIEISLDRRIIYRFI